MATLYKQLSFHGIKLVIHDVPELRIVDDELWQKAQARLGMIRDSDAIRKARP